MGEGTNERRVGVALLLATSILWSVSGAFVKIVQIAPTTFALWRSLAAGIAVAPLIGLSRDPWPPLRGMLLSVLLYAAVVSLLITAMTRGTAASGILLQYTGPAFCALLAWGLKGRRIKSRTWAALVLAMVGVAVMVMGGSHSQGWVGPTCGVLSGFSFGALILALENLDRSAGGRANPFAIVAINNIGCAILLIPIGLMLNGSVTAQPWKIGLVCLCGAVQLGIPYVLFQLGLRRVSAVDASLLILLEPVLNPVWVWLAVGERPDFATLLGGVAIILAMALEATGGSVR